MDKLELKLTAVIDKLNLINLTPEVPVEDIIITEPDIHRPALQLTGYFENFSADRIQIMGIQEHSYIKTLSQERKDEVFDAFLAKKMPAFIFTHGLQPDEVFKEKAVKYQVPLLSTEQQTAPLIAEILRWLNVQLAPCKSMHGVLVDCYGVGVLLMGESGIGKSEAALELVKRGHRLVTDDVVEIHKVSEVTLVGTAPEITRNFIELRGVGVVDIKTLFGVQSVIETACIDLVIKLKEWDQEEDYDRLGLNDEYIEILGNKVICHSIPIRPGRNLAVIVEAAAINYRQKKMGYNAAQELYKRVQDNLEKKKKPTSRIIDY
ncbi:MAG: HPr(Ser) kinase/phosphatase [Lachnospiraceae bacterium]|nr:HPr(Ser) kinase/phosphatase [Lachnospiraceae bacterium]MBQ6353661.1 HPr(Ser) kinase/phosphatase [Lachnospiraceae bacterium]